MLTRVFALLAVLMLMSSAAAAQRGDALQLVQTIPLGKVEGRIDHMYLSPDGKRLFIAALGNNSVEIVNTEGGVLAGRISGMKEPQGVAYLPESRRLVVASGGQGQCLFYDEALMLVGKVDGLDDADNVRYDAKARLLYVGYGSGALAVIDPEKMVKVADIRLDGHPESFQLEANGQRIFVNVPTADQIVVINREKRAVVAKWPVKEARANFPMALDETSHRLLVGCRRPARLLVLDAESGKVVASLDCPGDTDDVFYDAAHRRIYVSGGAGTISIFEQADPDHYRLLETVPTAPGSRTSLLAPNADRLFVATPHRDKQRAEIRVYRTLMMDR